MKKMTGNYTKDKDRIFSGYDRKHPKDFEDTDVQR